MATIEGTKKYFKRLAHKNLPAHAVRTIGKTGFQVNCIGFGGYRIYHNSIEHSKSLRYALLNGFNLVDTSSNYTDGGSEMLIGSLLQEMIERQEVSRDEIVIVSKVGYVQGRNLQIARQYEKDGMPFPEMVKYMDGCWHCIHPEFLEDQLSRSLERMQLPSIDVYLLHNPEYFLSDSKKRNGQALEQIREKYYARIKLAFEWMEQKVSEGKIKAYGVSSNTFPSPSEHGEFTSLEKVLEVAAKVSANHYFRVIQFPLNLFEIGPVSEQNQQHGNASLLEIARNNGLGTLVNRPLNAMYGNGMIRLANFRESDPQAVAQTFNKKLTTIQRLEKQYHDQLVKQIDLDVQQETLQKLFSLSRQLGNALTYFQDWEHWDHVNQNLIYPQTMNALNYLSQNLGENSKWVKWAENYVQAVYDFLDSISRKYENQAQERSIALSGKLKSLDIDLATSDTLSQQALRILTSTGGVDCVLLGMRRIAYVEDALAAAKAAPLSAAANVLIELNEA